MLGSVQLLLVLWVSEHTAQIPKTCFCIQVNYLRYIDEFYIIICRVLGLVEASLVVCTAKLPNNDQANRILGCLSLEEVLVCGVHEVLMGVDDNISLIV
jgi:hypothetical protein